MILKVGLALLIILGGKSCNIDFGNLDELVVTYDITVANQGPGPAIVAIYGKDVKRRAIVAAGTSVTATSFAGGSVLISVSPATDYLALLKARRDEIVANLNNKPLDLGKSLEVYRQLEVVNQQILSYQNEQHGSLCSVELKTDSKGKGVDVSATTTFADSRFTLAC
jgi:hypothetical protein